MFADNSAQGTVSTIIKIDTYCADQLFKELHIPTDGML